MSVKVHIPSMLRAECDGESDFQIEAATVRDALNCIEQSRPVLFRSVCYETGAVRQHVNLFVNSGLVGDDDLDVPLEAGDNLFIMPAVSGG